MRVADPRLGLREDSWKELDAAPAKASPRAPMRRANTTDVLRAMWRALSRAACTDLMLAEAHDLPRDTVAYLHGLVGRAHNAVYRGTGFRFSDWGVALFGEVPRQLRSDPAFRIAAAHVLGRVPALRRSSPPDSPDFARGPCSARRPRRSDG